MNRQVLVVLLTCVLVLAPVAGGSAVASGPPDAESLADASSGERVTEVSSDRPASANGSSASQESDGTDDGDGSIEFVEPDGTTVTEVSYDPNYTVEFWSGAFTPSPGLDPAVTDTERARTWVLVQFVASPYASTLDELGQFGYRDVGRLSATTRYAEVPVDGAGAIADHESVRAVTRVHPSWKLRPSFERELAERPGGEPVQVALQTFANLPAARADGLGLTPVDTDATGVTTYYGSLTPGEVRTLRREPRVMWIESHSRPTLDVSEGRRLVGAHLAERPGPGTRSGYTGKGVRVGVVDTGLDHGHPHFDSVTIRDAKDWWDAGRPTGSPGTSDPPGQCDHGTHVAGTIAGSGTDTDRGVEIRGVAPEATLVPTNVFRPVNKDPSNDDCEWVKKPVGLKKIFNKVDNRNVDVISNSWGDDTDGNYDIRASWVDTWARNNPDVLLVTSNGNAGETSHVGTPAVAKNILAVGAIRDGSIKRTGNVTDRRVNTTNADSSLNDLEPPTDVRKGSGRKKPELYAPGHWTTAPVLNSGYGEKFGTSMAAPHVSGVAALVKEKYPSMGANQLRAELIGTAVEPRYDGYGVVNANNALFENAYEGRHTHMSGSVKKHRGLTLNDKAREKKKRVENDEKTFSVSRDAERLVVTLTWLDPGNLVSSRSDRLSNDLDLTVSGPNTNRKVTTDSNVKQVVVEDPDPGQWTITVHASEVTAGTSQDYDVVYRTVTAEPTLDVEADKTVTVEPWMDRNQRVTLDATGTGAPVSGIYLDADLPRRLSTCGNWGGESVAGILSQGHTYTESACIEVPSTRRKQTFTVDLSVNTSNGEQVGGTSGRNTTRTVTFEVLPNPDPDLFDRSGRDNGAQSSATDLNSNVRFDHGHLRCIGGGKFSGGRSAGDDCSSILSGGKPAAASEYWTATLRGLTLDDDGDVDHYNLTLPATDTPSLSNPECGTQQVSAGGTTRTIETEGRLVVDVKPANNSLTDASVRTENASIPLRVYDDGREVTAGSTDRGPYGVQRTIPCPRAKGLSDITFSFGEGAVPNAGGYELEVQYLVDVTRPDRITAIRRQMAVQAERAEQIEQYDLALGADGLPRDFDRRLDSELRCPGTYLCGERPGPWFDVVNNERVLVTVENARGAVSNRYLVVVSDGEVTETRAVGDPAQVDQTVNAYTDVTTVRWVVASENKLAAIGTAYENDQLRMSGTGFVGGLKFGAMNVVADVAFAVNDLFGGLF